MRAVPRVGVGGESWGVRVWFKCLMSVVAVPYRDRGRALGNISPGPGNISTRTSTDFLSRRAQDHAENTRRRRRGQPSASHEPASHQSTTQIATRRLLAQWDLAPPKHAPVDFY